MNGQVVGELIDHMVVSPAIWSGLGAYKIKTGSCQVEEAAWQMVVVGDPDAARDNRPATTSRSRLSWTGNVV